MASTRIPVALSFLALLAQPLHAQESRLPPLALGDRFLEANAGFSWYSPRGGWGLITGRRVYLTGLRSEWVIEAKGRIAWSYMVEWVPLAAVERTRSAQTLTCYPTESGRLCEVDRSAQLAVGTGLAPFGLKMYVNPTGRARFFASATAGLIAFSSDVPVYDSRRLNYMFDYGGGVDLVGRNGRAVTLGYRFHHISNGASGRVNPGLDANIIYIGLRRKRARSCQETC